MTAPGRRGLEDELFIVTPREQTLGRRRPTGSARAGPRPRWQIPGTAATRVCRARWRERAKHRKRLEADTETSPRLVPMQAVRVNGACVAALRQLHARAVPLGFG